MRGEKYLKFRIFDLNVEEEKNYLKINKNFV